MKSKNSFGWIVNPFYRIAGLQAFLLGLLFVFLMGIIGRYSNVCFDGVFDMHLVPQMTFYRSFSLLTIDLFCVVSVMWITGLIISKSFRFLDILGTMTLAKAPFIILALTGFFIKSIDLKELLPTPHLNSALISLIVIALLSIPVLIWTITLMYNALKISCDVKGTKLNISFIIALIVSEIVSKISILLIS